MNCCELPVRTLAGFGATETWTLPEDGGLGEGAGEVCDPEISVQSACKPASTERRMKKLCRNEMPPKENAWFSGYGWSSLGSKSCGSKPARNHLDTTSRAKIL